jgi:O-Antigen ligase
MARTVDSYQRETILVIAVVTFVSLFAGILGGAAIALTLLWIPAIYFAFFRTPPWLLIRLILTLGLFLEPKGMVPSHPLIERSGITWDTPLDGANFIFYWSIKEVVGTATGIDTPFSISLCFIAILAVLIRTRKNKSPELSTQATKLGVRGLVVFLVAIAAIEAWGVLRGGRGDISFFQIIQLVTRPLAAIAFIRAMRGAEDLRALGTIVVTVACARGLEIAYIYLTLCLPAGITPEHCTTHGDSTTLAIGFLILLADLIESRTKAARWRLLLVGGFLITAMVMNNRRLAFMATAFGALGMYLSLPPSASRKKLNRRMLYIGPLIALYMFIGEGQDNPFFKPAKLFWSAVTQKDTSSDSRDVENDNLIATLGDFPLVGQGFGWEYKEVRKEYDIGQFMALYKYIPHNSVLWMWSMGGVVGFILMWIPVILGILIAAHAYRISLEPDHRAAALASIGAMLVVVTVDWGDVGAVSDMNVFGFALAYAIGVRLAARAELEGLS